MRPQYVGEAVLLRMFVTISSPSSPPPRIFSTTLTSGRTSSGRFKYRRGRSASARPRDTVLTYRGSLSLSVQVPPVRRGFRKPSHGVHEVRPGCLATFTPHMWITVL